MIEKLFLLANSFTQLWCIFRDVAGEAPGTSCPGPRLSAIYAKISVALASAAFRACSITLPNVLVVRRPPEAFVSGHLP